MATMVVSGYDVLDKTDNCYKCGDLVIARCQDDEVLAYAYSRFKREGLLDLLFYENHYTMYQFISKYLEDKTSTLACFTMDSTGTLNLSGIGWINDVTKMGDFARANSGMAFFRKQGNLVLFAQMMIEWALDHLNIEAMHGVTPAKNRAAVLFSRKCGFQIVGPLDAGTVWDGEICPVYLSAMTQERWNQIRPWRSKR